MAGYPQSIVPENTRDQVRILCDQIRAKIWLVKSFEARKTIEDATDCIETLLRANGEIEPTYLEWYEFGLTKTHARLLNFFIEHKGRCVSKDAIMNALYFDRAGNEPQGKLVDVHICHLRKKIADKNLPYRIDTIWGAGYKLTAL